MIITNDNIAVTLEMMEESNMTRFEKFGVPVDPKDPGKGLEWKELSKMKERDFDAIEQYFMLKLDCKS